MDWCHPCEINTAQVEETGLFHTECQQCSCHSHFLPLESRLCNWSLQDFSTGHQTAMAWPGHHGSNDCKWVGNSNSQRMQFLSFFWGSCVYFSSVSSFFLASEALLFLPSPLRAFLSQMLLLIGFFFSLTHFSFFWPQFCFYNEAMLIRAESLWVFFKHRERSLWNGWGCFFHPMAAVQKVWSIYFPITIKPFPG